MEVRNNAECKWEAKQSEGRIAEFSEEVSDVTVVKELGWTAGGLVPQELSASVKAEPTAGCLTCSSPVRQQLVLLQLSVQGRAIDLKYLSGLGHVPFRCLQGMHKGLLFGFLH